MAYVKVTEAVTIRVNDVANVHYPAGFEGRVPKDHAERIEAAGKGKASDTKADAVEGDEQ
ncbi:hypothetical protein [Methylobacterium sp. E-045]|uniref:hypothetical protein n=1 Tax=Methylobacterium sp. E-045 TaxID=2836575 RepID=UPI001FBA0B49|nr:hypothetical protein [Methylobacterium sp. E-045]MCJ2132453.1 hypothetical protein [Methylobacterium sp. E-045]